MSDSNLFDNILATKSIKKQSTTSTTKPESKNKDGDALSLFDDILNSIDKKSSKETIETPKIKETVEQVKELVSKKSAVKSINTPSTNQILKQSVSNCKNTKDNKTKTSVANEIKDIKLTNKSKNIITVQSKEPEIKIIDAKKNTKPSTIKNEVKTDTHNIVKTIATNDPSTIFNTNDIIDIKDIKLTNKS